MVTQDGKEYKDAEGNALTLKYVSDIEGAPKYSDDPILAIRTTPAPVANPFTISTAGQKTEALSSKYASMDAISKDYATPIQGFAVMGVCATLYTAYRFIFGGKQNYNEIAE